jgi:hypothetical protein
MERPNFVATVTVRADQVSVFDTVWWQDWRGQWVGGFVQSVAREGNDDVVVTDNQWFGGQSQGERQVTTSRSNMVVVSVRD